MRAGALPGLPCRGRWRGGCRDVEARRRDAGRRVRPRGPRLGMGGRLVRRIRARFRDRPRGTSDGPIARVAWGLVRLQPGRTPCCLPPLPGPRARQRPRRFPGGVAGRAGLERPVADDRQAARVPGRRRMLSPIIGSLPVRRGAYAMAIPCSSRTPGPPNGSTTISRVLSAAQPHNHLLQATSVVL